MDESSYAIVVSQWQMQVTIDDAELERSMHAGYRFVAPAPATPGPLDELAAAIMANTNNNIDNAIQQKALEQFERDTVYGIGPTR